MIDIIARYPLAPPEGVKPVMRSRTVAWSDGSSLVVVSATGSRTIDAGWSVHSYELTSDGSFLLALGDDARRGAVWDAASGRRLYDFAGEAEERQSVRAGLAILGGELLIFLALRNKHVVIRSVPDGQDRGWLSTTGPMWFHVLRVFALDSEWLAIFGYHDGEARDTLAAIAAGAALRDPMALYGALIQGDSMHDWGYRAAVGPAGAAHAVVFRDPECEEDEEPADDPYECFRGLVVWDLAANQVAQRIAYTGEVVSGAVVGAGATEIAIEAGGGVDVVSRASGLVRRVEGVALDPYRLETARREGGGMTIVTI